MSQLNFLGLAFMFGIGRFPFEQIKLTKITFIATLFAVRFNLVFFQVCLRQVAMCTLIKDMTNIKQAQTVKSC